MAGTARLSLGGAAKVYCVHDREKRVVADPEMVKHLGRALGVEFDPRAHLLQSCACCQNLFVTVDDTPRLCDPCSLIPTHPLTAAIPQPNGARHG